MTLSKKEAVKKHRELWNKVAELINTKGLKPYMNRYHIVSAEKIKEDALRELGYRDYEFPYNSCWCCEYDKQFGNYCCSCPIQWRYGDCDGFGSEFHEFQNACNSMRDILDAAEIARIIANLPERKIR